MSPMAEVGAKLRAIRRRWRLSLREVEQRTRRIAEERGDSSYQISASWLNRLESDEHELTVSKLIALAEIYSIPADRLIRLLYRGNERPPVLDQPSSPNGTVVLTGGSINFQAECSRPAKSIPDRLPEETTLLTRETAPFPTPYRRGIIGKLDLTLDPLIPPGSIVQIDTRKREILLKKNWSHEFQRPIYFLRTQHGYLCGWCELDDDAQWLTLIPHPLSPASSRRLKYPTEVENLGRVMGLAILLGGPV
jgi:transcriptional regulator with XRE-family HTH domain